MYKPLFKKKLIRQNQYHAQITWAEVEDRTTKNNKMNVKIRDVLAKKFL